MTVAVMPGLPVAELIAAAMPERVSLLLSMLTLTLCEPRDSVSVPVPIAVLPSLATCWDTSCCAWASWVMATLYVPATAPELAAAVKAVGALLVAARVLNAPGVSIAESELWKLDSALLRAPSAEICAVTALVLLALPAVCAA